MTLSVGSQLIPRTVSNYTYIHMLAAPQNLVVEDGAWGHRGSQEWVPKLLHLMRV